MDDRPHNTDIEAQLRRYADHVAEQVAERGGSGPADEVPVLDGSARPTSSRRTPIYAAAAAIVVVIAGLIAWSIGGDDADTDVAVDDAEVVVGEEDSDPPDPEPEPQLDVSVAAGESWPGEWTSIEATRERSEPLPHIVPFGEGAFVLSSENGGNDMVLEIFDAEGGLVRRAADGGHIWRSDPAVVWTGTELVILGGSNGPGIDEEAIAYNPSDDLWRTLADPPAAGLGGGPGLWTGDEVLLPAAGLSYRPADDRWRVLAQEPLEQRSWAAHVWTGTEMIVWGGCRGPLCDEDPSTGIDDGLAYDPATDTWRELALSPVIGAAHATGVWTGEHVVFFVGGAAADASTRFLAYAPTSDAWTLLPDAPFQPARYTTGIAAAGQAVFWGGLDELGVRRTGVAFDPVVGSWSTIPAVPSLTRLLSVAWVDGSLLVAGEGTRLWRFEVAVDDAESSEGADETVAVPAVIDLFADIAIQTLRDAGFDVATVFELVPEGDPSVGRVITQDSAPSEPAPVGTIVTITVGESTPEATDVAETSPITETAAFRVVDGLLEALRRDDWELADRYLNSGATTPQVLLDLGVTDQTSADAPAAIADYCRQALCGAPYEILGLRHDGVFSFVDVRFESADGPVVASMQMSWWEGATSINALPPIGRIGEPGLTVAQRLFGDGDRPDGEFVVARTQTIEWSDGGHPTRDGFWSGRNGGIVAVVGGQVVFAGGAPIVVLDGGFGRDVAPGFFAGASDADGRPVVFAYDEAVRGLLAYDIASEVEPSVVVLDGDEERSASAVSVGDELIAVTYGFGHSAWIEISERDGYSVVPSSTRELNVGELSISAGVLAPDDSSLVMFTAPDFPTPYNAIARYSTDGAELGSWPIPPDESIDGSLDFDGRWILAGLTSGRVFVVDTAVGTAQVVDVYAQVFFD